MNYGLTKRQTELLTFIREYFAEHGFSPSFDEIRDACRLKSKSNIFRYLNALEERGYVRRLPARARSIVLCERNAA